MSKKGFDLNKIRDILSKTKIIDVPVREEMSKSFISYAMAVNVSRAIPDVRDGFKPVHRRILFAMSELNNTYDKPHKKCARIVGEVMGKFHPHGDSSVYDALVRMGQDFSIMTKLIDGHGNFGSVDGDPPAAMRYTEARLSKIAGELLRDIDRDTVDFYPNFDDTLLQPTVLPAKFPNLLVNGSEGIAVGMATNIPPHNLKEVINGTVALLDNPDISIEELMDIIPSPDYPTGGIILGRSAVRQAYRTGRGGVVIRAKAEIEEHRGKNVIVVTEIPYQVNKANLIKNIADQVRDKKLEGISNIAEESDRFGMRIVIELKRDANPQVVLNTLYKQTSLQVKNGITFLALVRGVPTVLNLKDMLKEYVAHQIEVIERRTRYNLAKAKDREHILKGLVIAHGNIDEVIAIIRSSDDTPEAQARLMSTFELSERQAKAILEMKLSRLTHLEADKLEQELAEKEIEIAEYEDILANPVRVRTIIKEEMCEIGDRFGKVRQSALSTDMSEEINIGDLIAQEDVVVSMTKQGYIKRMAVAEYKAQNRGGLGVSAHKTKDEDYLTTLFVANTHDDLLFFSNFGKVYSLKTYEVPEASKISKGKAIVNILALQDNEKITAFLSVKEYENGFMVMATKNGLIKKCYLKEFENIRLNGKIAVTLIDDDELIGAELTSGEEEILIAASSGKCIRFKETDVRSTGRGSQGVKAISLDDGEAIVDMAIIKPGYEIFTMTENGYGKRSDQDDYRSQTRAGKGVKAGNFTEKTGGLVNLKLVRDDDDVIITADNGTMIRIQVSQISKIGRSTQGVRIMRLRDNGKVASIAITPHEEDAEYAVIEDAEDSTQIANPEN